jgi:excisionase family DNA binding protein
VTEGSRLALSVAEAAEALGVSRDSFERHVISELHLVRVGRRLLVPTQELERWIERQMAIPLVAELSGPAARHRFLGGQRAE